MFHHKWQMMFTVGALVLVTLFPAGAALAATPTSEAARNTCLQRIKEGLGTVLPSSYSPAQCDRLGSAGTGLIPVTGEVNGSLSWSDFGTTTFRFSGWRDAGASGTGLAVHGGWRDTGAGSR